MRKKLLSAFLVAAIILTCLPVISLAQEDHQLQGKVVALTPEITEAKNRTETDSSGTACVVDVTVTPAAQIPFSQADSTLGRSAGWWAGIKIEAPASVTSDTNNGVRFRNSTDSNDRLWVRPVIDGGNGTAEDPYYMGAWNGITAAHLKSLTDREKAYTLTWYFNWDGDDGTGITVAGEDFTANSAAEMKGVDQIINFTFRLTGQVKLMAENGNDVVWLGKQTIQARDDGNGQYREACAKAGLTLDQADDGSYILTIDKAKLEAVVAAGKGDATYDLLNRSDKDGVLFFPIELLAPDFVKAQAVQVSVGEGLLLSAVDNRFFSGIDVYDGQVRPAGALGTSLYRWLDTSGNVLAVTEQTMKVEVTEPIRHCTVTFDSQEGSAVSSATVAKGSTVNKPSDPTREGYVFGGWYKEADCQTAWKFDEDTVTEDVTLYAQWTEKTSESKEYTITFNANGGSVSPANETTQEGKVAALPTPTRTGYTFDGWFTAASGGEQVTKDRVYTADTTLYAHWTRISTVTPNRYSINIYSGIRHGDVYTSHWYAEPGTRVTITVTPDTGYQLDWVEVERTDGRSLYLDRNGRRYTFTMPESDVTVDARFVYRYDYWYDNTYRYTVYVPEETVQNTFVPVASPITWRPAAAMGDVPAYSWAYPAAQWAYQNGYLDLAADGTFRLNDPVSHQQMWRIMARWLGGPVADARGVATWALQNGAAQGKPAAGAMTRQNVVEYLYQCYFLMGGDTSVTGNLAAYQDSRLITSASAQNAWLWAVNKGIISGTADGYLNPGGVVNRGEFATILMRLCQNVMR